MCKVRRTDFKNRQGEINYNNFGNRMEIIEYNSAQNIVVEFSDGYTIKCTYGSFKKGALQSVYDKTVYGIGCLGEGRFLAKDKIKGKITIGYQKWASMLQRCYDKKFLKIYPTYIGCSVCNEWLNFQNFAKWFYDNWYEIEDEQMHLDKDILQKGNKLYSPETCVFVPQRINELFVKKNANRGKLPIGVYWDKKNRKFRAQGSTNNGKSMHLGSFNSEFEAFQNYKIFKETRIKQVADEYKEFIPKKLYDSLYKYNVEITD